MLRCTSHGGGEVATARTVLGGVARGEGTSAKEEGGEELLCDAWKLAGRRWRGGGVERRAGGAVSRR